MGGAAYRERTTVDAGGNAPARIFGERQRGALTPLVPGPQDAARFQATPGRDLRRGTVPGMTVSAEAVCHDRLRQRHPDTFDAHLRAWRASCCGSRVDGKGSGCAVKSDAVRGACTYAGIHHATAYRERNTCDERDPARACAR